MAKFGQILNRNLCVKLLMYCYKQCFKEKIKIESGHLVGRGLYVHKTYTHQTHYTIMYYVSKLVTLIQTL